MRVTQFVTLEKVENKGSYSLLTLGTGGGKFYVADFSGRDYSRLVGDVVTACFDIYFSKKKSVNTWRFVGFAGYMGGFND